MLYQVPEALLSIYFTIDKWFVQSTEVEKRENMEKHSTPLKSKGAYRSISTIYAIGVGITVRGEHHVPLNSLHNVYIVLGGND